MKISRLSKAQIMGILKQADGGLPHANLIQSIAMKYSNIGSYCHNLRKPSN
jgi:hypothetical protein